MTPRVAIIGGGISGLSTAYYLGKAGIPSILIESRPRLGGVIETRRVEDCIVEAGPDSFLSVKPHAMALIRDLGLEDQVIGSNDHLRKTYVWKNRRLVPLPDGLMMMVPTRILPLVTTRLLGWTTKLRMGLELLHPPPKNAAADRSVAELVARHYGSEAVDYLAEPLLSGIYGGNPEVLSVRSVLPRFVELESKYGSLTRGVLAERRAAARSGAALPLFRTLKNGLGQLIAALQGALRQSLTVVHARAEAVERAANGWQVHLSGATIEADALVLACEAHNAATLARPLDARLADLLASVPYSSSMTVALGFSEGAFARPLNGFGFLVPKRERRRLVACTWVGTKFSHRVPAGKIVLRCFLGGTGDADVLEESDAAVLSAVLEELRDIVGVSQPPEFTQISRWRRSMAQYTVGHEERIKEAELRAAAIPALYLAGNAYHGIGIPDCIRMGKEAAEKIGAGQAARR